MDHARSLAPLKILGELIDIMLKTAAKIGSLILGDDILSAKTLQKGANLVVGFLCFLLVCHLTNFSH